MVRVGFDRRREFLQLTFRALAMQLQKLSQVANSLYQLCIRNQTFLQYPPPTLHQKLTLFE